MKRVSEEHKKEVHKRNNVKWDRENMRSLTCRLRREQADVFKAYCAENNTTPGRLLKEYVLGIPTPSLRRKLLKARPRLRKRPEPRPRNEKGRRVHRKVYGGDSAAVCGSLTVSAVRLYMDKNRLDKPAADDSYVRHGDRFRPCGKNAFFSAVICNRCHCISDRITYHP